MVSPDASTESRSSSSSGSSMDEKEKRFYNRLPPSNSYPTQSESQSGSSEQISNLPQKKTPARTPTTPSKPPPSSGKRPRNEDEEPTNKKAKKPKPTKEEPKKISEDKKKVKQPEPQPSPQKSSKKPILWGPKEEANFLKAIVAYCQDGKEFPKNTMTPVYDFVRNLNVLDHEYSNPQLGEKFRRLRVKFGTMDEKVKGGGYSFKTAHDEAVYKLSKKIWGREKDEEESEDEESEKSAEEGNGAKEDRVVKKIEEEEEEEDEKDAEEEENKSTGEDVEMIQKEKDEDEEEDEEEESNAKQNRAFSGIRKHVGAKEAVKKANLVSNGTISIVEGNLDGRLIDQLRKENSVMMNEIKDQFSRENKELKGVVMKMVRAGLQSSGNGNTKNAIGFSSEDVVKKLCSARELPALDVAEARVLEQKWQRQLLAELEVCSGHLALLQEECQKRMEKLGYLVDDERH